MLKKPTLENMDKRYLGVQSSNGDIVARIKDELVKETKGSVRANINETLIRVTLEWKVILIMLNQHLMVNSHDKCINNLKRIALYTSELVNYYKDNNTILSVEEKYTLLERMYFETCCFEYRGTEHDIIQVNDTFVETNNELKDVIEAISKEELNTIIDDFKEYVTENLYGTIGSKIFRTSDLTSNQRRQLKNTVEKVYDIYDFIIEKTSIPPGFMSFGLLVILFAEVVFIDKNEIIENNYYKYKKMTTVNAEIRSGKYAHDKSKILIVHRVLNHFQEARGFNREIMMIRDIEKNIDFLMNIIFSQHSMKNLLMVHSKLYHLVRPSLFFEECVEEKEQEIIKRIEIESGFTCKIEDVNSIRFMFREYMESEGTLNDIVKMAKKMVKASRVTKEVDNRLHELEMIDDDGYKSVGYLIMSVYPCENLLIFRKYGKYR